MQISNNNSLAFGSIQVNLTRMTPRQRRIGDRLFNTLKYSEKYSKLTADKRAGEDLDIYILPKSNSGVEVRFIDPYSGNYVKTDNKIIKEQLYSTVNEKVEAITDKIVDIYEKIVQGKISRPNEDIPKFVFGDTDVHRLNPDKAEDLSDAISEFMDIGLSEAEAKEQAFEQYKNLYHVDNKDADF